MSGRALTNRSFAGGVATAKFPALTAAPPGVVTRMGPVDAPTGIVAVIWLAELTVNVAPTPLNDTSVAPVKFAPAMATLAPTGPEPGVKPVMAGALAVPAQCNTTSPAAAADAVPPGAR